MPDLRGKQQCLASNVGQFRQALTMMFSCKNLALNMAKSLSFLFFYSTFQHFLVKYIKRLLWKGWSLQKFWLEILLCIFKFYDCTKFHHSQVTGEKSYQQPKFSNLFFLPPQYWWGFVQYRMSIKICHVWKNPPLLTVSLFQNFCHLDYKAS